MCGIVGYVGNRPAADFLLQGLRRLEYRGYDSSGIATISSDGKLAIVKKAGRIDLLEEKLMAEAAPGAIGIGHTRWATHGPATDVNAHPHVGGNDLLAVVHNGVIDNFRELRDRLEADGRRFVSATDTEVIAHLIATRLEEEILQRAHQTHPADRHEVLVAAVSTALAELKGTLGLAVVFRGHPDVIVAARRGSPLVIGVGKGEHFVASDPSPLVGYTDEIVYMKDHEVALITADALWIVHRDDGHVSHKVDKLEVHSDAVELGDYAHYMLKEIFEQPDSIENAMRGRLDLDAATAKLGGLNLTPQQLKRITRIVLTGCGTSWHAGMVGEYMIEELARLPVEVEYASELRYRNPPLDSNTLLFAITQSGETADTLAAMRELQRKGHVGLAICNVVGSSIAQEANGGIFLHAGPEIGVASTKAFTSQCTILAMLALFFGRMHHLGYEAGLRIIGELQQLPDKIREALACHDKVQEIAAKYYQCQTFLYLGRQYNFPAALEGALKLKEISYIHAEGYPAAEMKHGPIALVDEHTPSVFLVPHGYVYDKVLANMQEIKARGGPIIAVVGDGDSQAAELADDVIQIPAVAEFLQPILTVIPLQLLAYHIAVLRGCDVDKPRNLAKSVTVE